MEFYIPIWLDLLLLNRLEIIALGIFLHSNMVRFIIEVGFSKKSQRVPFTFQYG